MSRRGRWRRTVAARVLSAVVAGAAVWTGMSALLPRAPEAGVPTVVVARDLPLGATLAGSDLRLEPRAQSDRPSGALADAEAAVGQVLAGPVLSGEIVTTARFRGSETLSALPAGTLAVSLPLGDSGLVADLRPGDRVTVLVAGTGESVAPAAPVLATDRPADGMLTGAGTGWHVTVALSPDQAKAVASALGSPTATGFVLGLRG